MDGVNSEMLIVDMKGKEILSKRDDLILVKKLVNWDVLVESF